ncbi:nicotinate phosphoribosyltransferase [Sistotremastrum niveocremeum HHB9708]|uniref:Nicotinate phosphoribosyltransferase n=1 Tax=Sistotremastrum niveocremeum HHB9708 TaxID=1314777 RepID=A0A164TH83_9AGAM|nr:nicotinate phosphoribosyltransferase [Sistotremastrum niveocremeum HHB9708]
MTGHKFPVSILDTDFYKLTMQQAVLHHFPTQQVTYRFTNRSKDTLFTQSCVDRFTEYVHDLATLRLTSEERTWLSERLSYFKEPYLDYLSNFRFNPSDVDIQFIPAKPLSPGGEMGGELKISVQGVWSEAIMWEVPLMAALSQAYYETVDLDWSNEGQEENAYNKAKLLLENDAIFSEFGTRRRRAFSSHDLVVQGLKRAAYELNGKTKGKLNGTSNVYLAFKHGLSPIGTIAHEWFMGIAALKGYENSNGLALSLWEEVYGNTGLVALTDTFSTEVFFRDFVKDKERANRWQALRQDSGDPFVFAPRAKEVYESLGLDHTSKIIVYSDGLSVDKALELKKHCESVGFIPSFGIGTNMTNDFRTLSSGGKVRSKPLNIVIKLATIDGHQCVKISDELTKNTGQPETVDYVKRTLAIKVP